MKSAWLLLTAGVFLMLTTSVPAQSIFNIPNPVKKKEWVVDLTNSIAKKDVARINSFCENIYTNGGTEFVVVVVPTTGDKSVEDFATDLLNHWGVGKDSKNDGILFLVAKDDRRMRIALGDGIDSAAQQIVTKDILDNEVTPRFKANQFGEGLYAGTFATALQVLSLAETDVAAELGPPAPNPEPAANNFSGNSNPNRNRNPKLPNRRIVRKKKTPVWPFALGGGALFGGVALLFGRRWLRYRSRNCERCNNELVLLTEEQEDQFLEPPEQIEERIGSVDYDVWACLECEDVMKLRYGRFFTRYSNCPTCNYKTKYEIKDTIVRADYSHGGRVRVDEYCENCPHRRTRHYSTPKLTKSKSSSGSGFGGGRGGGGRSFGGGRSSGGGASGSW